MPFAPTVLLVSGNDDFRAVVTRVLSRAGYHVVAASHTGHALLAGLTKPIDLVAAELSMDEMSGPALTGRLRRHHPGVQALYFGNAGSPLAEDVLVRPFTGDDLLARLHATMLTAA
jgi:DNA-binding response OmpR family regulator